jgi:amino-acid N-acetyltransferase
MIRRAQQKDVRFIHQLLVQYGGQGVLLARPLSEIYEFLRDFVIAEDDSGERVGVCALHLIWEDLCEIRSLAVLPAYRGQGWGTRLAESCISEAVTLGFHKIFVLTYRVDFFKQLGFREVEKQALPNKIWADCVKCVKFPDCDETALLWEM